MRMLKPGCHRTCQLQLCNQTHLPLPHSTVLPGLLLRTGLLLQPVVHTVPVGTWYGSVCFAAADAEQALCTSAVTVLPVSPLPAGASFSVCMVVAVCGYYNDVRGRMIHYITGFRIHVDKSTWYQKLFQLSIMPSRHSIHQCLYASRSKASMKLHSKKACMYLPSVTSKPRQSLCCLCCSFERRLANSTKRYQAQPNVSVSLLALPPGSLHQAGTKQRVPWPGQRVADHVKLPAYWAARAP
jgi:hypothetical protein